MGDQTDSHVLNGYDLDSHVDVFRCIGVSESNQIDESMFAYIADKYSQFVDFCQEITNSSFDNIKDIYCNFNPDTNSYSFEITYSNP